MLRLEFFELNTKRFNAICSILKDDSSIPVLGLEREVKPPFKDFGNVVHREASEILVRHISYHKETKQTYRNKWDLASPIRTKGGVKLTAVPTKGDTVLYGHRTLQGSPFLRLDSLKKGDVVTVEWPGIGEVNYTVKESEIIAPTNFIDLNESHVNDVNNQDLYLVTCHPIGSSAQRLVVTADLDSISPINETVLKQNPHIPLHSQNFALPTRSSSLRWQS